MKLVDLTGITAPPTPVAEKPELPTDAVMPEPIVFPQFMHRMGEPERISVYRHADGSAAFAVGRWQGKQIYPIAYADGKHVSRGYSHTRPLYNSDVIAANPGAPVLVVEGEKAAECGAEHLPDGWCITTWAGGTNATHKSDWSILQGRRVVVWPDNDEPGLTAAEKIVSILGPSATYVKPSKNYPKGWDLADPLPQGMTKAMVAATLMAAYDKTAPAVEESVIPFEPEVEGDEEGFIDEHLQWRPLGFDDDYYYVMTGKKTIFSAKARDFMSPAGCLSIINDLTHWESAYPARGKAEGARADWTRAGSEIMAACERVGFYDERRLRGRGVWMDDKRVVVNMGDSVLVNGQSVSPVKVRSRFIYRAAEALLIDGLCEDDAATDADGRLIVELCNAPRWDKPMYGDLLAGYIATSMICGALDWRTHVWVTGNAGSGKSTVMSVIAAACIGDVGVYPLGPTTEAGIRQFIGNDARPVIFDEMEGMEQSQGDARRQAIISLMRMASSTGRGRIMKGSAGHKATSFTMQSSFLVASIGMSLKEAPDLTRTLVLSLRPLPSDATEEQKKEADDRYATLNRLAARLPYDIPNRLFARQARLVLTIRENAKMFCEVIADVLGNRRLGDQVGTLLAGRCSLTSDKVMTRAECEAYVNRFEWRDVVAAPSDREDRMLLNHLKQVIMRLVDVGGRPGDRTMGEIVDCAFGMSIDPAYTQEHCDSSLPRFGLKIDRVLDGIWISSRNEELNRIMRGSSNPVDWYSVVSRNPAAERSTVPVQFAGGRSHAVFIPRREWYA